jgi:hypothetical protein
MRGTRGLLPDNTHVFMALHDKKATGNAVDRSLPWEKPLQYISRGYCRGLKWIQGVTKRKVGDYTQ